MLRFPMLGFVALVGSAALAAQSPTAQDGLSNTFILQAPAGQSCPIAMHAQQGSGTGLILARKAQPSTVAARIHLILDDTKTSDGGKLSKAVRAQVTVRGTNGKSRIQNTSRSELGVSGSGSPWIEKTVQVPLIADTSSRDLPNASADLELPGFTSVNSIRLDSVTYADGRIWTPETSQACRVTPDPFMLVSSR